MKNNRGRPLVGIIMGSDSDLSVMKEAAVILEKYKVPYHLTVVSAHRTPERMMHYAKNAESRGIKVIIAGAGGASHLPGMVASLTSLPVIGVPIKSAKLSGLDSLFSIVQMPAGVPVATVAINGSKNAGILACQILGTTDREIFKRLVAQKAGMKRTVLRASKKLESQGFKKYLKEHGL